MKVEVTQPSLYLRVNGKLQEHAVGDQLDMDAELAKKGGKKWQPVSDKQTKGKVAPAKTEA